MHLPHGEAFSEHSGEPGHERSIYPDAGPLTAPGGPGSRRDHLRQEAAQARPRRPGAGTGQDRPHRRR